MLEINKKMDGEILQNDDEIRPMSVVGMGGYSSTIVGLSQSYSTYPNGQSY